MDTIRMKSATAKRNAVGAALLAAGICSSHTVFAAAPVVLKEMPGNGVLRLGEVVYVDDGACPVGQVKKLTGGNQKAGIARQVECVKRPEGR